MRVQAGSLPQLTTPSLTDVILALCASGHFGVREAIAAAIKQKSRLIGPDPFCTSLRKDRDPESSPASPGFRLSPE